MKVATVLESSWPLFMILRHKGMISVCIKKVIASLSSPYLDYFSKLLIYLDQSSDNTQTSDSQVLKRLDLAGGIEERIKEKRNVSYSRSTNKNGLYHLKTIL